MPKLAKIASIDCLNAHKVKPKYERQQRVNNISESDRLGKVATRMYRHTVKMASPTFNNSHSVIAVDIKSELKLRFSHATV